MVNPGSLTLSLLLPPLLSYAVYAGSFPVHPVHSLAESHSFCSPLPLSPTSCSRLVRERKSARSWDRFSAQQEAPPTMTAILQPALVSLYHITLHCIAVAFLYSAMRSYPRTIPPWSTSMGVLFFNVGKWLFN